MTLTRAREQQLYNIAKRTLEWAGVTEYSEDQVWSLVMLELANIKEVAAL